jgi:hypothetical protein
MANPNAANAGGCRVHEVTIELPGAAYLFFGQPFAMPNQACGTLS